VELHASLIVLVNMLFQPFFVRNCKFAVDEAACCLIALIDVLF